MCLLFCYPQPFFPVLHIITDALLLIHLIMNYKTLSATVLLLDLTPFLSSLRVDPSACNTPVFILIPFLASADTHVFPPRFPAAVLLFSLISRHNYATEKKTSDRSAENKKRLNQGAPRLKIWIITIWKADKRRMSKKLIIPVLCFYPRTSRYSQVLILCNPEKHNSQLHHLSARGGKHNNCYFTVGKQEML